MSRNHRVSSIRRLLQFARPFFWPLLGAFLLLLVATGLEMTTPWLMKVILDQHIAPGLSDAKTLGILGAILLALYFSSSALMYVQSVMFQHFALKTVHNIRTDVFAHVLRLPMSYFDSEPTGRLISRITNDSEVLRQMFVAVIPVMLQAVFRVVAIFIAMSMLSLELMLMAVLLIPIILYAIKLYQTISSPIVHGVRSSLANINTRLNETLGGMRIVQAMGQERYLQHQFEADNTQWSEYKRKNINIDSLLLMPFTHLLNNIALAVVVGWFGYQSGFTAIEVGTLYAFVNYLGRFFDPFRQITMQMGALQQAVVAAERLFEVKDVKPESHNDSQSTIYHKIEHGKLVFDHVNLSYDGKHQALDDVSFTVEPGQFIAIVGHSGSGKSSIINLLMRFYPYQSGEVSIDGHKLGQLSEDGLRQGVGLVFQEPYIFSGTISENISLDNKQISEEMVIAAAKKVHADRFIEKLPGGFDHKPGAGGKALSIGERQLLSFARTIAQDPKILLLDEATANIDGETEHQIKEALITLREGRTTIAVAHRLSTIQDADQILVMEQGKIVQRGKHDALLQQDGHYRDLYLAQQAEEELSSD